MGFVVGSSHGSLWCNFLALVGPGTSLLRFGTYLLPEASSPSPLYALAPGCSCPGQFLSPTLVPLEVPLAVSSPPLRPTLLASSGRPHLAALSSPSLRMASSRFYLTSRAPHCLPPGQSLSVAALTPSAVCWGSCCYEILLPSVPAPSFLALERLCCWELSLLEVPAPPFLAPGGPRRWLFLLPVVFVAGRSWGSLPPNVLAPGGPCYSLSLFLLAFLVNFRYPSWLGSSLFVLLLLGTGSGLPPLRKLGRTLLLEDLYSVLDNSCVNTVPAGAGVN